MVSLLITIGGIIAILSFSYFIKGDVELIDLNLAKEVVSEDMERVVSQEAAVYNWVYSSDLDVGSLENNDQRVIQRYREQRGVVEFLFASILLNDPDLFIQSFRAETISQDLFLSDNPNKEEVVREVMTRISRNGLLEKLGYEEITNRFNSSTQTSRVYLYYLDGEEITIKLSFKKAGTSHHTNDEIYFITTSIWDIYNSIPEDK